MSPTDPTTGQLEPDAHDAALARLAAAASHAQTERIEAQIPGLVERFADAGIDVLVLKGPATRLRLFGPDETRPVADIDLLVDPALFRRASRVLGAGGYQRHHRHGHSDAFSAADPDRADIDLHLSLPFVTVRPRAAFATLNAHRSSLTVAGRDVGVLDEPAHAVHLALHAAVNRFDPQSRTLDEWRRAHDALDPIGLEAAQRIGVALGVEAVWSLAVRALHCPQDVEALSAKLPLWEIEPRLTSLRRAARSGVPAAVRWRDVQRMVALQLGDGAVNEWRRARGQEPVEGGSLSAATARIHRLVDVSYRAVRRTLKRP